MWPDRIIRFGFYLLFILVPLALTPWNYELFEYNKMLVVYGLTAIITAAWCTKMILAGEIKIAKTPLDIPIVLFLLSQLVSTIFSIDHHVSWWGYYSRFNGGMWSIISYVLLYYAFISNYKDYKNYNDYIGKLLKIALTTATIVAAYGVAQRLGIDKHLWVQDVVNRVFSTLGQPNWLAAYLAALTPLALGFVLKSQASSVPAKRDQASSKTQLVISGFGLNLGFWIWSLISILFFIVILFTRSRSGLLGFAVADGLFWGLIFLRSSVIPGLTRNPSSSKTGSRLPLQGKRGRNDKIILSLITFHLSLLAIVFVNGTHIDALDKWLTLESWKSRLSSQASRFPLPASQLATPIGTLLETGGTESGTIRKHVWQGAVNAWKSSTKTKLIGTGTETFAFAFYQYRPKEHNLTSEWDFLYNKAHNEYLNYLATTGIFGLGSYLLFIGAFIFWFMRQSFMASMRQSKNADTLTPDALMLSLFAGCISLLVTNFFGFSVVVTNLLLFLFPAVIIATSGDHDERTRHLLTSWKGLSQGAISALCVIILVVLGRDWYADSLYALGYRESHAGQFARASSDLSQAVSLHPTEPIYHDEVSSVLASLSLAAAESKESSVAAELMKKSLTESDIAIKSAPNNVNFWKTRTKVFYSLSSLDPQFNQSAIDALDKARALSPTDPKITYNLAILRGRQAENDAAISLLKQTIDLKPNYRDAYWALSLFYTEIKRPDMARQTLQDYLDKVDPKDKEFLEKTK